ncbi:TonB-dependent receptor domain-containing protein [uncultured Roseibium sp.]|uniref:TonB-dependent receptor domain-containing protein n=1 Tax=uncultured Roseibium sp. TaxID=1936171 RepID=UPI00321791D0
MSIDARRFAILLSTVSTVCLGASSAFAQDGQQLETVVVRDTAGEDSKSLETDVVITREDITRDQPADLKQLFSETPSVQVSGGSAASQKILVHGVDDTLVNVTVDGVRQNQNIWHHNSDFGIDPMFLKAVDVYAGVSPADAGPNALGGSIVFETIDAMDLLESGQTIGALTSFGYDTNSQTYKATQSAYGAMNGFDFLGALTRAEGQDYDDGDGNTEIGTAVDLWTGLAKASYQSQEGHRFSLSGDYYSDTGIRRQRVNIREVTRGGLPTGNVTLSDQIMSRYSTVFKYTNEKADGLFDPEVLIYFNQNELDISKLDGTYGRGFFKSTYQSVGGHVQNTFNFSMGSVTTGVDFYNDNTEIGRDPTSSGTVEYIDETVTNIGAYTQARLNLFEQVELSTGLRADFQNYDSVDNKTFDNFGLSPNITLAYEIIDGLRAKAGYSYVFGGIPQSETALFHAADYTYADDIEATYAHNAKVGLEYSSSGFTVGGELFYLKNINTAEIDFTVRTAPVVRSGPDLTSKGVDLYARYRGNGLYLNAAFSHADVELDGLSVNGATGDNLGQPVGSIISLTGAYTFEDWQLTLGASSEIALEYEDSDLTAAGFVNPLPGYAVFNTYAEWKPDFLKSKWTLRAEANNIFDETYTSRGTYSESSVVTVPLQSPGRSFYLTASAKF